jgi:hypothetical protein
MEKHKPHYLLKAIQAQMSTPEAMNLTLSALEGMRSVGMAQAGIDCDTGFNRRKFL